MPDPFCSSQQLWVLLKNFEKNVELQSTDKGLLNLHRDMIFENVKYFKPRKEPVEEQKKKLKKDNVTDDVINFIDSLSSILDLDLLQTYDLLFSFLLHEYSGGKRNINKIVSEENSKNSLISSIEQYYFQERIHIVKCLTKLVKLYLSTSAQQPFWDDKFKEKVFCPQFIVSVLRDFTDIYERLNFTTFLEKQGRSKCRRLLLHYYSFQEEILKLLIWSFHIFDFSVDSIVQVLETLTVLRSCQKFFVQKVLTVHEVEQQDVRLECLQFLFVTKVFDLELLFYTYQSNFEQESSMTECNSLWLTIKNASKFDEALSNFGKNFGDHFSGGFYLSWSLNMNIRKSLNENFSDVNYETNLTKCCVLAKQNDGFSSCLSCLTSKCIRSDEELFELASAIIYLIIDGCFSLFEPFSIGNVEFINVFQKFPCYVERFTTFDRHDFVLVGESLYESAKDRRPYSSDAFIIPAGSIGQLLETSGDYFEIRWRVLVNGWQILLTELNNDSTESEHKNHFIFQLIDAVLTADPSLATQFVHFLNEAVEILKASSLQNTEDVQLFSSSFSCLSQASAVFPDEVLNMLVSTVLLPSPDAGRSNLIGKIINDFETKIGEYSFCLNFLELVSNLLNNEILLDDANVTASVGFVVNKVFPFYLNWSFIDEREKDLIGRFCLEIFQKSIESLTISQKHLPLSGRLHRVSKIVVDSLMFGEARHNLMKIASAGPDVLRDLLRLPDSEEGACRAFEMVSKSISLISQLVDVANVFGKRFLMLESKGLPPLFANFFDKCDNFVSVLGKYIIFSAYESLPRLALLCLEKIADTFPCSFLSAFGETVEGFCDVFLNRLESPFENWQLKLSCVNFFTVCIEKQAGLAEKLTCSGQSSVGSATSTTDVNECGLKLIFDLLRQSNAQPELFVACIRLFSALWRCKWTESTKILKKLKDFWLIITSPLTASEEDFYLKICSEVFELLLLDLWSYRGPSSGTEVVVDEPERNSMKVVEKLLKSDRIELIFVKLKEFFESNCETEKKLSVFKSWSNFINVALIRGKDLFDETVTFDLIHRCSTLQFYLMTAHNEEFLSLIECTGTFYERFIKFASSSYIISSRWTEVAETFGHIIELLSETSYDEQLASISISPLYASLVILSEEKRKFVEKLEFIQSILNSLSLILNKLITQFMQLNDGKTKSLVHKSMFLTIGCIRAAVRRTEPSIWLPKFKKYCLLPNLLSVLSTGLNFPRENNLFDSITNLFSAIIQYEEALCTVRVSGFNDFVCSKLPSFYPISSLNDGIVFGSLLTFYTSGLTNLRHKFVDDALVFVCSWEESFTFIAQRCFDEPSDRNLKNLKRMCLFLRLFSLYKERWIVKVVRIYDVITQLVSKTSMRLIAYLSKPSFIKDLPLTKSLEDGDVSSSQSHRSHVQLKYFESLLICTQILLKYSPNLENIPSDFNFDPNAFKPLCDLDFSTNINPEVDRYLTFGGLLLTCILSVNCLKKIDGIKSTSPSIHRSPTTTGASLMTAQIEKNLLTCLVETTVYLCISQGFVQMNQLWALDGQEALIKRELGTELDLILSKCGRSSSSPSTPRKSPAAFPSPAGGFVASFDQDFVKLTREFVRVLFKS